MLQRSESSQNINFTMKILSAIGILLVISGHFGSTLLSFGNLYPYDTFHMAMFVFISGYFYQDKNHTNFLSCAAYIKKKFLHLMLPYFLWNIFYYFINRILAQVGFKIGNTRADEVSLFRFFVRPFQMGDGFGYNVAAWFLGMIFLVEVINVIFRFLLKKVQLDRHWILLPAYFLIGYSGVCIAKSDWESSWKIAITRTMYMLFWYYCGLFYKKYLEKYDNQMNPFASLTLNIAAACFLVTIFGNEVSIVYTSKFLGYPIVMILRSALGILFWLRISKMLTDCLKDCRPFIYIGNHTFSLMMHQGLAGIVLNGLIALSSRVICGENVLDMEKYKTAIWYGYAPSDIPQFRNFYVLFIPILILLFVKLFEKIYDSNFFKSRIYCIRNIMPVSLKKN